MVSTTQHSHNLALIDMRGNGSAYLGSPIRWADRLVTPRSRTVLLISTCHSRRN